MKPSKFERTYTLLLSMAPELARPDGLQHSVETASFRLDVLQRDPQMRPVQILVTDCSGDADIVTEYEIMLSHEVGFAVASYRRRGDRIDMVQVGTVMNAVVMEEVGEALESWLATLRERHSRFPA